MTLKMLLAGTTAAGTVLAVGLNATPSAAQTTVAATPAADAGVTVGEVVVTTRRRAERLQDVPLSVTALTAVQLEQAGVQSLGDAAALTPGLLISNSPSETGLAPNSGGGVIRGLADNSGTGIPTVAVFFNGVALPNAYAVSVGMIDMERIEIVKGPVSALYGRGGFAGAINYVTKAPSDSLQGHVTGEYGDDGKAAVYGEFSGPLLKEVLSVGVAGTYDKFDGGYRDQVNGLRAGGHEKKDVRASFAFTPTRSLAIAGGWYHGDDNFDVDPQVHVDNNCGAFVAGRPIGSQFNYFCGEVKVPHPVEVAAISSSSGQSANQRKVDIGDLHFSYDLGAAVASAIFGYNKVTEVSYQDFTSFRNGIPFTLAPGPGTANLFELFGSNNNNEDLSLELRLASRQDQIFRWSIGGYYSTERSSATTVVGEDASQIPSGQTITGGFGLAAAFLTSHGQISTSNLTLTNFTDKQLSPFASAEIDVIKNLTAFGELRYTDQTKSFDPLRNDTVANVVHPYGAGQASNFYFVNYRTGLRFKFDRDVSAYATVATGEKPGGFNQRSTGPLDNTYAPETNTSYEAGVKTELLERRLLLNAAIFYIEDSGLQVSGASHYASNPGTIITNFGNSTSKGFELEGQGVVNDLVTLTGSLAYADPIFGQAYDFSAPAGDYTNPAGSCAVIASCAARVVTIQTLAGPKSVESLKGLQTPFTSKWIGNLGVNFKGVVFNDVKWFGRAEYRYESKRFNQVENLSWVGDRNIVNVSAGLTRGHVAGMLYVNNLTDDRTPLYTFSDARLNDFGSNFVSSLPNPRLYGARLSYTY